MGKPLSLVVSNLSSCNLSRFTLDHPLSTVHAYIDVIEICYRSTQTLYLKMDASVSNVSPEEIVANVSMAHKSICQSTMTAKLFLLLEDLANFIGNKMAIFGINLSANNDTRAPSLFIQEQN